MKPMPQRRHLVLLNGAMTTRVIPKPDEPIEPLQMTAGQVTFVRQPRSIRVADELARRADQLLLPERTDRLRHFIVLGSSDQFAQHIEPNPQGRAPEL